MFKVIISESIYDAIMATESGKAHEERSLLSKLFTQQQVEKLSAEDTALIQNNHKLVLDNPSSLYILDIPEADAISIQQSYGVVCMNGKAPSVTSLIDTNDDHTTDAQQPLGRGWDSVLDSVEHLPSNALIMTDRYLFRHDSRYKGDGFANIYDVLHELLPKTFAGEYHITIVFDYNKIDTSYTFEGIATRLNKLKQQFKRGYPIMMEVVGINSDNAVYKNLHNRRIVSNYYLVKIEHMLAAFNKNYGTTEQTITPQVLFTEESINGRSSAPLKTMSQTISALRAFHDSIPKLKDHGTYRYAINGKTMEKCDGIKNRLIK